MVGRVVVRPTGVGKSTYFSALGGPTPLQPLLELKEKNRGLSNRATPLLEVGSIARFSVQQARGA